MWLTHLCLIGPFHFHFKGCYVLFFTFIQILQANSGDPDQTPHSVAFYLGVHCLPISQKKDTRLISGVEMPSC